MDIAVAVFEDAEELDWAGPWEVLSFWARQWPDDGVRTFLPGGDGWPPRVRSRTPSRRAGGHSAASVGTVETTVMRCASSHGPRSTPVRTSARGAGTHAPGPCSGQVSAGFHPRFPCRRLIRRGSFLTNQVLHYGFETHNR